MQVFEDDSETAAQVNPSLDCQASEGFTRQMHNFSFQRKKQPLVNRNIRTVRKRKIPAGRHDRRTREAGGERWASFTVFSIAKCMNKVAAWSGCPVSNPDPNNTVGLFLASFCAREPGKTRHSIGFALLKLIDQNEVKEWIMIAISTVTGWRQEIVRRLRQISAKVDFSIFYLSRDKGCSDFSFSRLLLEADRFSTWPRITFLNFLPNQKQIKHFMHVTLIQQYED